MRKLVRQITWRASSPRSRGSVISPVRAAATAVSGDTRYTLASAVPLRPSKLRLKVRRHTPPELGEKPMPMQGPQAHSSSRAPEARYVRQRAAVGQHGAAPAWSRGTTDMLTAGGHGFSLQHGGDLQHIVQRGIGAGADADLIHLDALQTARRSPRCPGCGGRRSAGSSVSRSMEMTPVVDRRPGRRRGA